MAPFHRGPLTGVQQDYILAKELDDKMPDERGDYNDISMVAKRIVRSLRDNGVELVCVRGNEAPGPKFRVTCGHGGMKYVLPPMPETDAQAVLRALRSASPLSGEYFGLEEAT